MSFLMTGTEEPGEKWVIRQWSLGLHYHIRWSNSSLDWKSFPTKEEATELARKITKPNESYTVVERNDDCERCKEFKLKGLSSRTQRPQAGTGD